MNELAQCALLIDGAHYDRLRSTFDVRIDFVALAHLLTGSKTPVEIRYYRDVRDEQERDRFSRFRAWLERSGIEVIGRSEPLESPAPRQRYGTNLLELAADAQRLAGGSDTIFLLASDFQLAPVASALRDSGTRVVIVSTLFAPPSIAAHETLLEVADKFVELRDLLSDISID